MDINRNNYETFFLDYLDRELSPVDRQSVEKFISENADLQKEFLLLQQTVLSPADIVFEPKASLFREEEKRRVVPFYQARVAAAVAVLILVSWYMKTIISKNHAGDLSGKERTGTGKKNSVSESKSQGVTVEIRKNAELPTNNKNQTAIISPAVKKPGDANKSRIHDLTKSQIHDQSKSQINEPSDPKDQNPPHSGLNEELENQVASAKSSSALELQSADRQTGTHPEHIPTVAGTATQTLVISTKSNDPQNENTALKERDFQNDNAISVVGLNDRNKAITGFFKKLTKRAPADENARKLRVSVFQISY